MKSKILSIFLALTFLVGVVGCSRDDFEPDSRRRNEQPENEVADVFADVGELNEPSEEAYNADSPTNIEVFEYNYRDDVAVISQIPVYTYEEIGNTLIVTVHNPNEEVKSLAVGDTFMFEAEAENLYGVAGHIENIIDEGEMLKIYALIPESLDEIFDEFEFVADVNLLADCMEIIIDDDFIGIEGFEIRRNPTRLVEIKFEDVEIHGIKIDGELVIYAPRLDITICLENGIDLICSMESTLNIKASSEVKIDTIIQLFSIPVNIKGLRLDIPVGIRINAEGKGSLEYNLRAEARFGIENGAEVAEVNVTQTLEINYSAKIELTANIKVRARFWIIPLYAVQGDFGKGAMTDDKLQEFCKDGCFIIGLYDVRRIGSLDWGLFRFLKFEVNLAPTEITSFIYTYNGTMYINCPHGNPHPTGIRTPEFKPATSAIRGTVTVTDGDNVLMPVAAGQTYEFINKDTNSHSLGVSYNRLSFDGIYSFVSYNPNGSVISSDYYSNSENLTVSSGRSVVLTAKYDLFVTVPKGVFEANELTETAFESVKILEGQTYEFVNTYSDSQIIHLPYFPITSLYSYVIYNADGVITGSHYATNSRSLQISAGSSIVITAPNRNHLDAFVPRGVFNAQGLSESSFESVEIFEGQKYKFTNTATEGMYIMISEPGRSGLARRDRYSISHYNLDGSASTGTININQRGYWFTINRYATISATTSATIIVSVPRGFIVEQVT
jgi:hypothetical protein